MRLVAGIFAGLILVLAVRHVADGLIVRSRPDCEVDDPSKGSLHDYVGCVAARHSGRNEGGAAGRGSVPAVTAWESSVAPLTELASSLRPTLRVTSRTFALQRTVGAEAGAVGVNGSRAGIVGGSIAGCAAAVALRRSGCDVTIFERSAGVLKDRGAGIAIPVPLHQQLIAGDYLDSAMPVCRSRQRVWIADDGRSEEGRVLWRQPSPAVLNNWGLLWRTLRSRRPDVDYRRGAAITGVDSDADGAEVVVANGRRERFDVVIGADGYRSAVRQLVESVSKPVYAGYVAWRGTLGEDRLGGRLTARELLDDAWLTICFAGGHAVLYLIPGCDGRVGPGHRRLNWVIYSQPPEHASYEDAASVAPGAVSDRLIGSLDRLLDDHLPTCWGQVLRATDRTHVSIQPIYDQPAPTYVAGRVALIGDAATVSRPHTGSGATKALQDALALERACQEHGSWQQVFAAYDAARCTAGNELVELGRRLGYGQVERTPDWLTMDHDAFDQWTRRMLDGRRLYAFGNVADESDSGTLLRV